MSASFPREAYKVLLAKKGLNTDISYLDSKVVKDVFTTTFTNIKQAITHKEDLEYVAYHCFKAFYEDNVRYLEVRSTPKSMADIDSVQYVQTIID
jgi:adenosine deaminase